MRIQSVGTNLLAAALQCDYQTLFRTSFEKITIKINTHGSRTVPTIEVRFRESKNLILQPQSKFINVLDGLFRKKSVNIDEKNELKFTSPDGRSIPLAGLSSGEKQLLIILGQALLQRGEQWVYIADEPELSLHVSWQSSLVHNIRLLNPKAQIIFATHSPDIVSTYSNHVFSME